MSIPNTPTRATIDRETQTFTLVWADGHITIYPLDGLRRACPCASCLGHGHMHELPDPEIFKLPALMRWENVIVEPAGSIGLRFTWDDGHNTGIYTWHRLRAMCPCDDCRSRYSTKHAN